MQISAIIKALEDFASPSLQEKWDNTGLQIGSLHSECTGVLVCLDPTPAVVDEAVQLGCNLIVTHHPLFFKPVRRLVGATVPEATAIQALRAGVAIYSSHTAADSTRHGVSCQLARLLGITPQRVLQPLADYLVALTVIAPVSHAEIVQAALFDAGAGRVGNYDCCSFNVQGTGTFRALDGAKPYVGDIGLSHQEDEIAINVVLPAHLQQQVERAMLEVHPYETPAYQFTPMLNAMHQLGLGIYGVADDPLTPEQFIARVKSALGCASLRATAIDLDPDTRLRRVAVCGGAGGDLIGRAIAMGAQAYVTADLRYHDFVEYRDQILLIDAGHYQTEAPIVGTFAQVLTSRFPALSVHCSATQTCPVRYL